METIVLVLLVLYFVMWSCVFCLDFVFKRRLKSLYPDLGTGLHPGILQKSIATDFKSTRFLLRGEYRMLDNPQFVRFCDRFRGLVIAWYIVFAVTVITVIVCFATHGKNS